MDTATTTAGRATPWNKGKLLGQKPPLKLKEIWAIRIRLQLDHRARELALFNLAIDSKFGGAIWSGFASTTSSRAVTSRPEQSSCKRRRSGRCNSRSPNKRETRSPLGSRRRICNRTSSSFRAACRRRPTIDPAVLSDRWGLGGIDWARSGAYGTHSLRRTKPTLIYRRTKNLEPFSCCSATPSSKVPSDTSGSRSTTHWRSRSRRRSKPSWAGRDRRTRRSLTHKPPHHRTKRAYALPRRRARVLTGRTQMLRRTCALVSIALSLFLFSATGAATTAQRTFVASTGNDTNPCSIAAPCRGFARAITQTSAGGEVIVLDSAGYGPVTVTKSASIIAPAGTYAGISVISGNGVTVNAPGATVVLRGLSINGQGGNNGIVLQAAARLRVENCVISAMHIAGISHMATAPDAELIVLDTIVRDNGGSGIYLLANVGSLVLDHVRSEHNGGNGVSLDSERGSLGALATIADSVFTHNEGDGIGADSVGGATITLHVDRSVMSNNGQTGSGPRQARARESPGKPQCHKRQWRRRHFDRRRRRGRRVRERRASQQRQWRPRIQHSAVQFLYPVGKNFPRKPSGAIRASGPGTVVAASANTAFNAYSECDNGALLYTYGNNVTAGIASIGCTISSVGLY